MLSSCPDVALLCAAALHLLLPRRHPLPNTTADGYAALPRTLEHELARLLVSANVTQSRVCRWRTEMGLLLLHEPSSSLVPAAADRHALFGADDAESERRCGWCARVSGSRWRWLHAGHMRVLWAHVGGDDDDPQQGIVPKSEEEEDDDEADAAGEGERRHRDALLHLLGSLLLSSLAVRVSCAATSPFAPSVWSTVPLHGAQDERQRRARARDEQACRRGVQLRCRQDCFLRDFFQLGEGEKEEEEEEEVQEEEVREKRAALTEALVHRTRCAGGVSCATHVSPSASAAVVLPSLQLRRAESEETVRSGGHVCSGRSSSSAAVWRCRSWTELWQRGLSYESRARLRGCFGYSTYDYRRVCDGGRCAVVSPALPQHGCFLGQGHGQYGVRNSSNSEHNKPKEEKHECGGNEVRLDREADGERYCDWDEEAWLHRFA